MSIADVRNAFQTKGIPEEIREFEVSSATVELAAQALGVAPELIAKTLSFYLEDGAVLVLAAGNARVDNKKFKAHFHCKAKMLSPEDVLRFTGHPIGGVCPFALATPCKVYLDETLRKYHTVYPAAGSAASCVVVTPDRLKEITNAEWIDVCKLPEESTEE